MTLQRIDNLNLIGFTWVSSINDNLISEKVEESLGVTLSQKGNKGWEETIQSMKGSAMIKRNSSTPIVDYSKYCSSTNTIDNKFFTGQQLTTVQNVKRSNNVEIISSKWESVTDKTPSNEEIKTGENFQHVTNLSLVTSMKSEGNLEWNERFNDLVAYKASRDDYHKPAFYTHDLHHWIITQRMEHYLLEQNYSSSLTPARISRLKEIGFDFAIKGNLSEHTQKRGTPLLNYKRNKVSNLSAIGRDNSLDPNKCSSISSMSSSISSPNTKYVKKKDIFVADKVLSNKFNHSSQCSTVSEEALPNRKQSAKRKFPVIEDNPYISCVSASTGFKHPNVTEICSHVNSVHSHASDEDVHVASSKKKYKLEDNPCINFVSASTEFEHPDIPEIYSNLNSVHSHSYPQDTVKSEGNNRVTDSRIPLSEIVNSRVLDKEHFPNKSASVFACVVSDDETREENRGKQITEDLDKVNSDECDQW
eukprot:CAMPEP_0194406668 /NCGR_PEP_ID=MMETSP0176-20130528/4796_1 /TAXON_ID=216777 /ORGANISM="Proboscia alata, Strain PI-D3" /LENGTH=475 /DNA_ID=CAMNT_0039205951 /DNA_START=603 /DNA_END=2027 /DNA_ORIENTATION=+